MNEDVQNACKAVGEIVLLASAIDQQLNRICILCLHLPESPLLEPVIAVLDSARKVELIKARAKKIKETRWKTEILQYIKIVEDINRARNIAAHSTLSLQDGKVVLFQIQLPKLLASIDWQLKRTKIYSIPDLLENIKKAEKALRHGEIIIENFTRLREEIKQRTIKKHTG